MVSTGFSSEILEFLRRLAVAYQQKSSKDLTELYDSELRKTIRLHLDGKRLPSLSLMKQQHSTDELFECLYTELCFRHIRSVFHELTGEERKASFYNYKSLFKLLLELGDEEDFMPVSWLWDIMDEFINQFAFSWAQTQKLFSGDRLSAEAVIISEWQAMQVVLVLKTNIKSSKVLGKELDLFTGSAADLPSAGQKLNSVRSYLGYFSLVGLIIYHCLTSDFALALTTLEVETKYYGSFCKGSNTLACSVAKMFHVGYVYMVLRQYSKALGCLAEGVKHFSKLQLLYEELTYIHENARDRYKKMCSLIAVIEAVSSLTLGDRTRSLVDLESHPVYSCLREGNFSSLRTIFRDMAPAFVPLYAIRPNRELKTTDWYLRQSQVVENEFKHFQFYPLKEMMGKALHVSISDLAANLKSQDDKILSMLLAYKYRRNFVFKTNIKYGNRLSSDAKCGAISNDTEFYIDKNNLEVFSADVRNDYRKLFMEAFVKTRELSRKMEAKILQKPFQAQS